MMIKLYESSQDVARERRIVACLSNIWNFLPVKLPKQMSIDYECWRSGKIQAYLEVKTRRANRLTFDTYMITKKQIKAGQHLASLLNVPFIVSVLWNDGLFYRTIEHEETFDEKANNRFDRNDPNDIYTRCYLIPTKSFLQISPSIVDRYLTDEDRGRGNNQTRSSFEQTETGDLGEGTRPLHVMRG